MIRTVLITVTFLMLLCSCTVPGASVIFPPESGTYAGDYVLIQEPGRYTLENNITHEYPAGVIIMSSSVILDGQGRHISPAMTGDPSVGIWVTLQDSAGNLVTGVRIQNLSIENEVTGIYIEDDSSEFPGEWIVLLKGQLDACC